jgi:DNA-binding response OmpR family regulator
MQNKKIVVIDDCRLTLSVVKEILSAEGYTVETAESSLDANPLIFCQNPPDLIMVDVEMPFLNGDKTVKHMRSRPMSKDIAVLMISAKNREELSLIAEESGADDYACKPLTQDNLVPKVRSLISAQK